MQSLSAKRIRGATLGTILLLTVVVVTLALALASTSVTHLHLSHRAANAEVARNMAESAISAGLERVLENDEFGALRTEPEVLVIKGADPAARGRLAFHKPTAEQWGLAYSTNNLDHESSRAGAGGRVVPGSSLHLVGFGEYNGARRSVEAIFHIPRFPYVVATSGRLATEGETLIASIDDFESLKNVSQTDKDSFRPGDVVANSTAADALTLSSDTLVTGDAKAAGEITLEPGAEILGQTSPNSSPETIPTFAVSDYDPDLTGKIGIHHIQQSMEQEANYEGWVRREGDLFIGQGLNLDNGVLYVNGNLTVAGGVTGTGAIFVNGDVTITGKSALVTDNVAAIISEGSITLTGPSQQNSVFRGLVYSNKGLSAENMTLVGTLLIGGEQNDLRLKDSQVIYSPDSVKVDLKHGPRTALHFVSTTGATPGAYLGTKRADKSSDNKKRIFVSFEPGSGFLVYPEGWSEQDGTRVQSVEEVTELLKTLVTGQAEGKVLQAFESTINPRLSDLLSGLQEGTVDHEEEAVDLLVIDPTHFLSLAEKIRLLLMREL